MSWLFFGAQWHPIGPLVSEETGDKLLFLSVKNGPKREILGMKNVQSPNLM